MATLQRLSPSNYLSDNDNINLYQIGEDIVATTESNFIHKIDPITLDTKDRVCLLLIANVSFHNFLLCTYNVFMSCTFIMVG